MHHASRESKTGLLRRNSSVNINDTKIAGLYDLEHTIGKGHFAVVKLARHVFTGEKVAVKVIDKTKLDPDSAADLYNEVRCMKLVQHPNIVRLYEVIDVQTKLFLILELGDYDLYEYLMRYADKGCKETDAQQYFSQIIKAIDYCHRLFVVHRDLKPENVVFFEKLGMVKLTDFGFSNLYTPGQQLNTSCGSLAYSAPEILLGDSYDAPAVDVWSLGVILFMLVCGRLPFQEANDSETLTRILDCRYSISDNVSHGCKDLIQRMLVRDPAKRTNLDYIVKSPWVRSGDKGHAEVLPLVSRTNLPENAHETIIEQMIVGGLGTEENILKAINGNEYSYLTATYYLLAERVLSAYREEQATRLRELSTGTDLEDDAISELVSNNSTQMSNAARSRSNSWRGPSGRRACTILKEESEEEMSTYLRSSSRQSSRFYTKREQASRPNATSRASSIESFRSSSIHQSDNQIPELPDSFEPEDNRRVGKKLSVIPAEDEENNENHLVSISEASPKTSTSNGSPKSNLTCSGLGFSNNFVFDELSPIREMMEANVNNPFASEDLTNLYDDTSELMDEPLEMEAECPPTKRRPTERQRAVSSSDEEDRRGLGSRRRRYTSSRNNLKHLDAAESPTLPRTPSEPTTINQLSKVVRRAKPPILRRNSSPSVAMFGPSGIRSSRDRVSPQAIQELLEFSRLSASMKRAASPDSRFSSRSPSPSDSRFSSGRVSPAISTMSGIVTRLKSSSLMPGTSSTSGMRKLSSSPHLLGICEETEETTGETLGNTFYTVQTHKSSLASSGLSSFTIGPSSTKANGSLSRGVRSASTGFSLTGRTQRSIDSISDLPSLPERASSSASNPPIQSYSSLRLVRPRQNIMSPDMCRRYEQHQRFISRSKRSTSCSSSENSDVDEETKERRRQVLGAAATMYCKRNNFDENQPDDEPPPKDDQRGPQTSATGMASERTTGKNENKTGTSTPATTDNSSRTSNNNNMSANSKGVSQNSTAINKVDFFQAGMRSIVNRQAVRSFSTTFRCHKNAKTRYILSMFPYPSGRLHMGHMRVYSISDALAQYYRLNGYNVLHPIGWDSFGLPAENAARLMGVQADEWTAQNIEVMREQLKRTGVKFDWDREISTCQPDFYKWTQWIFVKLFENNLVHRRYSSVFWDPVDETVLAAEQIDANGRSWRSGAVAEKRKLRQWAIETPKYAKRLFDGLHALKNDWQEVAAIQANWIGKCDVFRFILPVTDNGKPTGEMLDLRLMDPTELSRAEFIVLQSDHSLSDKEQDQRYISSKVVTNFVNGRKLPIVFLASNEHGNQQGEFFLKARLGFTDKSAFDKLLAKSLSIWDTDKQLQTADQIFDKANQLGVGGYQTSRILQDWVVSRQRAWGTPIPIVIDNEEVCRSVPVSLLPVLSEQRGQLMSDNGRIETDTLDTFFDSAWYYLRFLDPFNTQMLADPNKIREHMPVDVYVGGIEHADVHLFFARFISHFLYDIGATSVLEPFQRLLPQGFVRGQTFIELGTGRYASPDDVENVGENEWKSGSTGKSVEMVYEKMSKSKANGVDPLDIIDKIGVDLTRLQLLGVSAPRANLNWGESDLKGMRKWIERMQWIVDAYVEQRQAHPTPTKFELVSPKRESYYKENYNYFVRNVSMCLELLNLHNTAIARLQGLTNTLRKMEQSEAGLSVELERCIYALVVMLQIFAPNTARKFWETLLTVQPLRPEVRNDAAQLSEQTWPQVDHDAEIDFFISMMDINCNRITISREAIEHLDDAKLIETAQNDHHKAFFKLLADRAINVSSIQIERHPGFHVTLNLTSNELSNIDQLRKLLSELASAKVQTRKEAKKQRRETAQAVGQAR